MILNPIKQDYKSVLKPVVLYGCGNNGKEFYDLYSGEFGWNILCFCDNDAQKHGKTYHGIHIYSIEEVKARYPSDSYLLYFTMKLEVACALIRETIKKEMFNENQILNVTDIWYGKSCEDLCSQLVLRPDSLSCCCAVRVHPLHIVSKVCDSAEESVSNFLSARDRLISQNQSSSPPCAGCPELKEGYWPKPFSLKSINFSNFHYCQFHCYYCSNSVHLIDEWKQNQYNSLSIVRHLLKELGMPSPSPKSLSVVQGNGEISLNPQIGDLLDFVKETSSHFKVLTNAGVYSQNIANMLKNCPDIELNVSLDCGTKNTFGKVKGVSLFEQVIENIGRYRECSEKVTLKYIILPENINDSDINGFIDICRSLDIREIQISHNNNVDNSIVNIDGVVIPAFKLAKKATDNNIKFDLQSILGKENLMAIQSMLNNHAGV